MMAGEPEGPVPLESLAAGAFEDQSSELTRLRAEVHAMRPVVQAAIWKHRVTRPEAKYYSAQESRENRCSDMVNVEQEFHAACSIYLASQAEREEAGDE